MLAYIVSYVYTGQLHLMSKTWEHPFVIPIARSRRWYVAGIILHVLGVLCALAPFGFFVFGATKVQNSMEQ